MTKISTITIYGFRGIRNQVVFDLGKAPKSMVLSAENGRGKSSLADAIEWYFQDTISHLQKEGCYESSYRHYRLPHNENAVVSVVTTDADVFGEKHLQVSRDSSGTDKYKSGWQNQGSNLLSFVGNAQGENVILRHAELKDFVNKTKTEKLKAVSSIIGFDVVTQTRDVINKVKGSVEKDSEYRKIQGQISEKERDIDILVNPIVGSILDYPSAVFAAAENLRLQLGGITPINDLESFQKQLVEFANLPRNEKSKEIQELVNMQNALSQSVISTNLIVQVQAYSQSQKMLLSKKENLEKLTLVELYKAGSIILEENPDLTSCPLCESSVSRNNLLLDINNKLLEFSEIQAEVEKVQSQADSVRQKILATIKSLQGAKKTVDDNKFSTDSWSAAFTLSFKMLNGWANVLNKNTENAGFEISEEELATLQSYNIETDKLIKISQVDIEKLSDTDADNKKNTVLQTLKNLFEHYSRWLELKVMEKRFQRQIKTLESLVSLLEQRERDEFKKALTSISDEVNDFYKALHPNEGFDQLNLIPTADRGLEFEFYFKGDKISPPNKFMSESHLNTLGLCFFLASAVEFNKNCEFVILDDIVSSVDADHRLSFARLLRDDKRLSQKQFVILSHDMHWSEILRSVFPKWEHKKIQNWDYDTGVSIDNHLDIRGQIQDAIQRGDAIDAARKVRDLVDISCRDICEDYDVNLPYRQGNGNEKRELKSFVEAIVRHFGKNNVFDAAQPPFSDIVNSLWLMNIASHPDPRKLNISMSDVKIILADLDKFLGFFYAHAPKCAHVKKKLSWDAKLQKFATCSKCNQPL